MFGAAGEVEESTRILDVIDDAEIALEAVLESNARLGGAVVDDMFDARLGHEKVHELFGFRAGGEEVEIGLPKSLFRIRHPFNSEAPYQVMPDGETFLVNQFDETGAAAPMTLVQNWTSLLQDE